MVGWDQALFYSINGAWTAPVLDRLMPALSRAGNSGAVWLALLGGIAFFGKGTGRAETAGLPAGRASPRPRARHQRLFSAAAGAVLAARRSLKHVPPFGWGMLVLAAAISYSRVYVGVYYPADVVAGAGLGLACGWVGAWTVANLGDRFGRSRRPDRGPGVQY